MFRKTTGTDGSNDAYTSPIFTVVGGENVNPEPKKSVPTVEKKILDDSKVAKDLKTVPEGDWKDVADSQIGQEVNYKLTGTTPIPTSSPTPLLKASAMLMIKLKFML